MGMATLFFADDLRTSQETYLWVSAVCYVDRFTFVYIGDVGTSEEIHLFLLQALLRE
jgi:hypothetical protein